MFSRVVFNQLPLLMNDPLFFSNISFSLHCVHADEPWESSLGNEKIEIIQRLQYALLLPKDHNCFILGMMVRSLS